MQLQRDEAKARALFQGAVGFVRSDRSLTMDEYARLVNLCADRLKMKQDVIWNCGNSLMHTKATRDNLYRFCYFLVVNKTELKKRLLLLDECAFQEETVLVRFLHMSYLNGGKVMVRAQILTGSAALKCFNISGYKGEWTDWLHKLGYGNSVSDYYITSLKACIPGLYAKLKMTAPSPSMRGHLDEYHLQLLESDTVSNYNKKEILKYRRCIEECPNGLSEQQACEDDYCALHCLHGWNFCKGSGHSSECTRDFCSICGKEGLIPLGEDKCLACKRNDHGEEDD